MLRIAQPNAHHPIKVYRNKFIASGRATTGSAPFPLVGVLKGRTSGSTVVGRTLVAPRQDRSNWAILFDLNAIAQAGTTAESYTLTIYGDADQLVPLGEPVHDLVLTPSALEGVFILSPSDNTDYCCNSFAPYGLLTDGDTKLESVTLQETGTMNPPLPADSSGCDNDGFWWAFFETLPSSSSATYTLEVHGNVGYSSVSGLKFLQSMC